MPSPDGERCTDCDGTGWIDRGLKHGTKPCPTCHGTGTVHNPDPDPSDERKDDADRATDREARPDSPLEARASTVAKVGEPDPRSQEPDLPAAVQQEREEALDPLRADLRGEIERLRERAESVRANIDPALYHAFSDTADDIEAILARHDPDVEGE